MSARFKEGDLVQPTQRTLEWANLYPDEYCAEIFNYPYVINGIKVDSQAIPLVLYTIENVPNFLFGFELELVKRSESD